MGSGGQCERCGAATGDARWCPVCGKNLHPGQPALSTPEALDGARRENAWLAQHPEVAAAEAAERDAAERARAEASAARRAESRPPEFTEYDDPRGRSQVTRIALAVIVVSNLVQAAVWASYLVSIGHLSSRGLAAAGEYDSAVDRVNTANTVDIVTTIVCGLIFIAWTHRMYSNLPRLGAMGLRFGTGWAIGAWFVPILGLWRPKQIVNDVWRASEPALPANLERPDWSERTPPALLALWWGLWLATGLTARVTGYIEDDTISKGQTKGALAIVSCAVAIAAAVAAIRVVKVLTEKQRERAERIEELPAPGTGFVPPAAAS